MNLSITVLTKSHVKDVFGLFFNTIIRNPIWITLYGLYCMCLLWLISLVVTLFGKPVFVFIIPILVLFCYSVSMFYNFFFIGLIFKDISGKSLSSTIKTFYDNGGMDCDLKLVKWALILAFCIGFALDLFPQLGAEKSKDSTDQDIVEGTLITCGQIIFCLIVGTSATWENVCRTVRPPLSFIDPEGIEYHLANGVSANPKLAVTLSLIFSCIWFAFFKLTSMLSVVAALFLVYQPIIQCVAYMVYLSHNYPIKKKVKEKKLSSNVVPQGT